jgi:Pyridoxamine 5'-phosphate oxidase
MSERTLIETTNLDRYGSAALPWSRPHDLLAASMSADLTFFLGTVRPDGRPHTAGIGALWHDGNLYITSGPETRKARNLAVNPACTIAVKLAGIDLVLEGEATRITDQPTLETVASLYRQGGWPAQVERDAFTAPYSAPSAGPPPWQLYRFTFHTAFGVATAEPNGATRWRFNRGDAPGEGQVASNSSHT